MKSGRCVLVCACVQVCVSLCLFPFKSGKCFLVCSWTNVHILCKVATLATERQHCHTAQIRAHLLGGLCGFFQLLDLSNPHQCWKCPFVYLLQLLRRKSSKYIATEYSIFLFWGSGINTTVDLANTDPSQWQPEPLPPIYISVAEGSSENFGRRKSFLSCTQPPTVL